VVCSLPLPLAVSFPCCGRRSGGDSSPVTQGFLAAAGKYPLYGRRCNVLLRRSRIFMITLEPFPLLCQNSISSDLRIIQLFSFVPLEIQVRPPLFFFYAGSATPSPSWTPPNVMDCFPTFTSPPSGFWLTIPFVGGLSCAVNKPIPSCPLPIAPQYPHIGGASGFFHNQFLHRRLLSLVYTGSVPGFFHWCGASSIIFEDIDRSSRPVFPSS